MKTTVFLTRTFFLARTFFLTRTVFLTGLRARRLLPVRRCAAAIPVASTRGASIRPAAARGPKHREARHGRRI